MVALILEPICTDVSIPHYGQDPRTMLIKITETGFLSQLHFMITEVSTQNLEVNLWTTGSSEDIMTMADTGMNIQAEMSIQTMEVSSSRFVVILAVINSTIIVLLHKQDIEKLSHTDSMIVVHQ